MKMAKANNGMAWQRIMAGEENMAWHENEKMA